MGFTCDELTVCALILAYVSAPHEYWSGYFTSRPRLKLYARYRENDLRIAEQYYAFAKGLGFHADYAGGMRNISFLREAIDVVQVLVRVSQDAMSIHKCFAL